MAKKTTKPRQVTKEVAALLRRIRARNDETSVLAAVSLADHLEHNDLPLAKSVRSAVDDYQRDTDYWSKADFSWKKRLGRNEVLRRVRDHLYWKIDKLFGRVTTSAGPKSEKMIRDKIAELKHLRTRIKRLETSAEKRGKQLIRLGMKHARERMVAVDAGRRAKEDALPGNVPIPGVMILDRRTGIRLQTADNNDNQHETPSEDGAGRDSTNDDETR